MWKADYAWEGDARLAFRIWDRSLAPNVRPAFQKIIDCIYDSADEVFAFFELPISNGRTEHANREIRRLIANSMDGMHLATVRLKARAHSRLKTTGEFHCDSCFKRTPDYPQKVSEMTVQRPEGFLVKREGDGFWLCEKCKDDVQTALNCKTTMRIDVPEPQGKPFEAYRHLQQSPRVDIDGGYSISYWKALDGLIDRTPSNAVEPPYAGLGLLLPLNEPNGPAEAHATA